MRGVFCDSSNNMRRGMRARARVHIFVSNKAQIIIQRHSIATTRPFLAASGRPQEHIVPSIRLCHGGRYLVQRAIYASGEPNAHKMLNPETSTVRAPRRASETRTSVRNMHMNNVERIFGV